MWGKDSLPKEKGGCKVVMGREGCEKVGLTYPNLRKCIGNIR